MLKILAFSLSTLIPLALPAKAVQSKLTVSYPSPKPPDIINADLKYLPDCSFCYSNGPLPVTLPIIKLKIILWLIKFSPPLNGSPDPELALLGISGNELGGNIYMDSTLASTFHQRYDLSTKALISNLAITNLTPDIPSSFILPYDLRIEEEITGSAIGSAEGKGKYFINDIFVGDYNVSYNFIGEPSASLVKPIHISSIIPIEPGPTSDTAYVQSGIITGSNINCVPAPLPLIAPWIAFNYSRKLKRRIKDCHLA
jgi:hypothetical protein